MLGDADAEISTADDCACPDEFGNDVDEDVWLVLPSVVPDAVPGLRIDVFLEFSGFTLLLLLNQPVDFSFGDLTFPFIRCDILSVTVEA